MEKRTLFLALVVLCLLLRLGYGQTHRQRGTLLGGLTGAIAGAAIGDHNDETAAGALIGGAVGAITGSIVGDSIDRDQARVRAYQHQQQRVQLSRAVSPEDVVSMTQSGVSDEVIINHIRQNGVQRHLEVHDVIALHQQGVSEPVIAAMQRAPIGQVAVSAPVQRPRTVVVEEHHYLPPVWGYYPRPRYHYPHHPPSYRRPGLSWGISIGR